MGEHDWTDEDAFLAWQQYRQGRVVKNEEAFRRHNRRRKTLEREAVGDDEAAPFVCECGTADCVTAILLSAEEYDQAHITSEHFTVAPGHVFPEFETVVDEHADYWVIKKIAHARQPSG
jgi:hypothetical protein